VTIDKIRLYRYQIALNRPLRISSRTLTDRTGLVLVLEDHRGFTGMGEIAPLPGLHAESLHDCVNQIKSLNDNHFFSRLYDVGLLDGWTGESASLNIFPGLEFGMQSAMLQIKAGQNNKTVRSLLSDNSCDQIPVNALITGEEDNRDWSESGYRTFKIKTGRLDKKDELRWILDIARQLPAGARLRFDANCRWDMETALEFCHALEGLPVEYLEEPLMDHRQLQSLAEKVNIPVALDEHLPLYIKEDIPDWIGGLVIKPTIIPVMSRLRSFRKRGIPIVLSDTFQTGLGISMLAELAGALGQVDLAMGFDTLNWLAEDILLNPPVIENGQLALPDKALNFNDLDQALLKEIKL